MGNHRTRRHFDLIKFIFELGSRLEVRPTTVSTAACIYHKFFQECMASDYDQFLIATTALYLAGKVEENHIKIREIIYASFTTLHRTTAPPKPGEEEYWNIRDSIMHCELLILRVLQFKVSFVHPHRYLPQFLDVLAKNIDANVADDTSRDKACYAFAQDLCYSQEYLNYSAKHIAIAAILLSIECTGIALPTEFQDSPCEMFRPVCKSVDHDTIKTIMKDVLDVYKVEKILANQNRKDDKK